MAATADSGSKSMRVSQNIYGAIYCIVSEAMQVHLAEVGIHQFDMWAWDI